MRTHNTCSSQPYTTDENKLLCLFFEDGMCKKYQNPPVGWEGFLPNPFDWAFKVYSPGRQTYVHGAPGGPSVPASPLPDPWCRDVVHGFRASPNLHALATGGCTMAHGNLKWYEGHCSARSACRCLINPLDNAPFCSDVGVETTRCGSAGNPSHLPSTPSPIGPSGRVMSVGRGGQGVPRGGGYSGTGGPAGSGGDGKPGPWTGEGLGPISTPEGEKKLGFKPVAGELEQPMWHRTPKTEPGRGRGANYSKQLKALAENRKKAKKSILKLTAGLGDQFNPDTQPKCGPLDPDCSPVGKLLTYATGTEVPP